MPDKSLWIGRPGSTALQSVMLAIAGLLPLHTRLSRACSDITVYLDPPQHIRAIS